MKDDVIVKFENVSKEYKAQDGTSTILKNVNFEIQKNSVTIIFGPSGSGKSTILNMILGLLEPTSGKIMVNNQDLYQFNQNERAKFRAQYFGSVHQTNSWVNSLNVVENIAMPLYLTGMEFNEANEKAKESLKRVGLEEYAEYSPLVLSVGQQQRVSMARATVSIPMLLLGDEPTGSLDSENGDKLMQFIVSFSSHNDSTIILVTHNSDYLPMSSHRIFIHDGVVAEEKGAFQADMNSSAVRVEEMIKVANAVKEAKLKKKNKKK